jgi:hypothetical protein
MSTKVTQELRDALPSFFEQLDQQDLLSKFKPGFDQGKYCLNPKDDKIWTMGDFTGNGMVNVNSPWIYTNNDPDAQCDWWHDIAKYIGYIPKKCMHCWKVCARPSNVHQLFLVMKLQHKMGQGKSWPRGCKCGIDLRPHTFGDYGAYWYNETLEQGLEQLEEVRHLVATEVDPTVPVTLKRGCTEFENNFGPSTTWEEIRIPTADIWDHLIEQHCNFGKWDYVQGDLVKTRIMKKWLLHSAEHGDPTVKVFTNGKDIGRPCQSYEPADNQEGLTEIKEDAESK